MISRVYATASVLLQPPFVLIRWAERSGKVDTGSRVVTVLSLGLLSGRVVFTVAVLFREGAAALVSSPVTVIAGNGETEVRGEVNV
jgi:hypothetical protein